MDAVESGQRLLVDHLRVDVILVDTVAGGCLLVYECWLWVVVLGKRAEAVRIGRQECAERGRPTDRQTDIEARKLADRNGK